MDQFGPHLPEPHKDFLNSDVTNGGAGWKVQGYQALAASGYQKDSSTFGWNITGLGPGDQAFYRYIYTSLLGYRAPCVATGVATGFNGSTSRMGPITSPPELGAPVAQILYFFPTKSNLQKESLHAHSAPTELGGFEYLRSSMPTNMLLPRKEATGELSPDEFTAPHQVCRTSSPGKRGSQRQFQVGIRTKL